MLEIIGYLLLILIFYIIDLTCFKYDDSNHKRIKTSMPKHIKIKRKRYWEKSFVIARIKRLIHVYTFRLRNKFLK